MVESFVKFTSIFAVTQIPLAISEGILTVIVFNLLAQYSRDVLVEQGVLAGVGAGRGAGGAAGRPGAGGLEAGRRGTGGRARDAR